MNAVLQTIEARYTCRKFTGEMPDDELLKAIAKAAVQAPSAMNRQGWRVVVVKDRALIGEMEAEGMRILAAMKDQRAYERIQARGGKLYYNAPCVVLVPIDAANPTGSAMDCGILCENITLAAASLGVASCVCGLAGLAFSEDKNHYFKQRLDFPPGYEFGIAVLLGFAEEPGTPHEPDLGKISFVG